VVRRLRIRSAQLGLEAAQVKLLFTRAMLAMEADTAYTRAVAARERSALSRRNALDADSLLHMVERRRDAGDASDMDVALARVNAGQQANVAAADSLTHISALLDLQNILGLNSGRLEVAVTDSLGQTPAGATPVATSLDVLAAQRSLESASVSAQLQRRSIWSGLSVALGFEHGDPDQPGILPTFGLGVGLPLFDRNRGASALAEAEREKARAELTLAEVEARNALALALRERENALARVARDRLLLDGANRVTAMSLTAYREGAANLASVLEAQRTARDVLGQYIDDLTAAWIATAELRVFSLSTGSSIP
jgi:cobalt-zinc-cadmium efflux system outer membrane protein